MRRCIERRHWAAIACKWEPVERPPQGGPAILRSKRDATFAAQQYQEQRHADESGQSAHGQLTRRRGDTRQRIGQSQQAASQ